MSSHVYTSPPTKNQGPPAVSFLQLPLYCKTYHGHISSTICLSAFFNLHSLCALHCLISQYLVDNTWALFLAWLFHTGNKYHGLYPSLLPKDNTTNTEH